MTTVKKGVFTLNFGLVRLSGDLSEDDRQCAWELYTELSTRVSVIGKIDDPTCSNYDGELYLESLNSLYKFLQESRIIMKKFPVGKIKNVSQNHLGTLISIVLEKVLRPFFENWRIDYMNWWESHSNPRKSPFERQSEYPKLSEFLGDWTNLRLLMRELKCILVKEYQLLDAVNTTK